MINFFKISDVAENWQLGLHDPATPIMEGIVCFHNHIMFFIILIVIFVLWLLIRCSIIYDQESNKFSDSFTHSTILEIVWTIIPAVVLVIIAVPSFALLYSMDEIIDPSITLKVIGHQWYWSYEYSDYTMLTDGKNLNYDSYMISEDDMVNDPTKDSVSHVYRLLEVDNKVVLPTQTHVRILVTSADVLHCWAIPSCGVKIDACPGRLNQCSLFLKREGTYYGQCSEICGVNHGFMPIVIQAVTLEDYLTWIVQKLEIEL
jgi:cytochrome c oxidase subunit 2